MNASEKYGSAADDGDRPYKPLRLYPSDGNSERQVNRDCANLPLGLNASRLYQRRAGNRDRAYLSGGLHPRDRDDNIYCYGYGNRAKYPCGLNASERNNRVTRNSYGAYLTCSLNPSDGNYYAKRNSDSANLPRGLNPSDRYNRTACSGDRTHLARGLNARKKNERVTSYGDISDLSCGLYAGNKDNNRTCPRRLEQGEQHALRQRFKLVQRQLSLINLRI